VFSGVVLCSGNQPLRPACGGSIGRVGGEGGGRGVFVCSVVWCGIVWCSAVLREPASAACLWFQRIYKCRGGRKSGVLRCSVVLCQVKSPLLLACGCSV